MFVSRRNVTAHPEEQRCLRFGDLHEESSGALIAQYQGIHQEEGALMAGKGSKKPVTLTQALAQFLGKTLLPDLKERAKQPAVAAALARQWQAEKAGNRTAGKQPRKEPQRRSVQ